MDHSYSGGVSYSRRNSPGLLKSEGRNPKAEGNPKSEIRKGFLVIAADNMAMAFRTAAV